jgi:hypothetical protein
MAATGRPAPILSPSRLEYVASGKSVWTVRPDGRRSLVATCSDVSQAELLAIELAIAHYVRNCPKWRHLCSLDLC